MRLSWADRLIVRLARILQRVAPWHRLPRHLGLLCLIGIRTELRQRNLYDPAPDVGGTAEQPAGAAGRPFGRNQPLWAAPRATPKSLLEPSPREVSRHLLARTGPTREVPFLNLLSAAWLQFMVHDWLSHGRGDPGEEIRVDLAADDDWPSRTPGGQLLIRRSRPSDAAFTDALPIFDNTETHWWDGSQIYGSTPERERAVRAHAGGRLTILDDGLLPVEEGRGIDLTGVNGNWWVGLSLMHTLFAQEHNAVCRMLAARHPDWDDDRLFSVARRITAAVMAKIHTIEWTPALVPHRTVRAAMRANWSGLLGRRGSRVMRRVTRADALIGIPGSRVDDHGVPYALTEEFVAVYRMHPLIPDEFRLISASTGDEIERRSLTEMSGREARGIVEAHRQEDLIASLATGRPGVLRLHNFPDTLRNLSRGRDAGSGSERRIDLAAIDIVRDRERGVPRYNDFRRMLRLPPARDIMDLVGGDADEAARIGLLYDDIEQVDLMVGLYAEVPPHDFGISETAFHIFILMASRRLKSDPVFTDDYRPEIYTAEGMRWVEDASMSTVIARHHPALSALVGDVRNPFAPWDLTSNRRSGTTAPLARRGAEA